MNIYTERVEKIRKLMSERGIGLYYIPMDDSHGSEYVADHFRCIEFVSGFTGSAGTVLISASGAWLYADGRYYVQAAAQLEGSCISLMKLAAPGVPDPEDFIAELMKEIIASGQGLAFGFDGNVVNSRAAQRMIRRIADTCGIPEEDVPVVTSYDLAGEIWTDRPAQTFSDIWLMDTKYTGESCSDRLARVRKELGKRVGSGYLWLVSSLDDIAWLFNIRADDLPETPAVFAYAAVTEEKALLFVGQDAADSTVIDSLGRQGVAVLPYTAECLCFGKDKLAELGADFVVCDLSRTSRSAADHYAAQQIVIKDLKNPTQLMKGVKNDTELANACSALLRDSAYVTMFMRWLKEKTAAAAAGDALYNDDGSPMSELSVDDKLDEFRTKDSLYIGKSFSTIAAYKGNAAMMHYTAKPDSYSDLRAEGMLLIDSGVQFFDGTTDITRTFILGPVSDEEKKAFTLTAVSMLRLMNAKFIKGCTGENLDILAREPMWENGWDYKCGTGHGVGHVLNVHEGENEIYVRKYTETEDGSFLCFEPMTFIPVDLDGIDISYMTDQDRHLLNSYHRHVREKLMPLLDEKTNEWLELYTREVL